MQAEQRAREIEAVLSTPGGKAIVQVIESMMDQWFTTFAEKTTDANAVFVALGGVRFARELMNALNMEVSFGKIASAKATLASENFSRQNIQRMRSLKERAERLNPEAEE